MITVEEKLNTFSKLVYERVKKESEKSLNDMYENNEKILKEHREKMKKDGEKIIDKKIKEAKVKKREMISSANVNIKKKILNRKKEMFKSIIKGVKKLAFEFTDSNEYEKYFKEILKEVIENFPQNEKIVIYLTDKDIKRFSKYLSEYKDKGIDFKVSDDSIIGGVIAIKGDSYKIDGSLKTIIDDNKDIYGRILYKELDKVGDNNE